MTTQTRSFMCTREGTKVEVTLIAGTTTKGIGYAGDVPVCVWASEVQPAPRPGSKWCWGDFHEGIGSGQQWMTISQGGRTTWTKMKGVSPQSGWSQL